MSRRNLHSIDPQSSQRLIESARDRSHISGLTHNFYRYPARFSPKFVRTAIELFSEPMDVVFDPFMGGGTTLVEALALGRHSLGVDISSLATFVSDVKTTVYSDSELLAVKRWISKLAKRINIHAHGRPSTAYLGAGYCRHLDRSQTWRISKGITQALASIERLQAPKIEKFARCIVLRTAQWALDGRKRVPSIDAFRAMLATDASHMINGANSLREAVGNSSARTKPSVYCLNRSTSGLESDPLLRTISKPKLVLTSPPYPGIHVLYHRWQVDGRKETPAPFWIANKLDGSGASYYTMGDRHATELKSYFEQLRATLTSVAAMCTDETTIIQVVAFSQPSWQLPRYLSAADDAGLTEFFLPGKELAADKRLWRAVPNRKWHAGQKGATSGSQEVVLFHRLA